MQDGAEGREATGPSEVVVVRLGGARYALPMPAVAEVGRPPALTRVPGLPDWVAGVVNWRGRVLAVLDLRGRLEEPHVPLDRRGRLVLLARNGVTVGLLTEGVEGTRTLDAESAEPALPNLSDQAVPLLCGQWTDGDGPCGLLDLEAIFGLAAALPRPRRAG